MAPRSDACVGSRRGLTPLTGVCEGAPVPFARRRYERQLQKEFDERERGAAARAHTAVSNVVACFCTDPGQYDVRAAVIWHPNEPDAAEIVVFKFGWGDAQSDDLMFDGPGICVWEGVEVATDAEGEAACRQWVGESRRQVRFDYLPGLFQMGFFNRVTGGEEPPMSSGLIGLWIAPAPGSDAPDPRADAWPVRGFPAGMSAEGPEVGQLGYVLMPRSAAEEILRLRGW